MFLIRDFVLALEPGKNLDDYLSTVLMQKPGKSQKAKNDIRDCITQAFPVREIMSVPPPHADPEILQNIQDHDERLSKEFYFAIDQWRSSINSRLTTKSIVSKEGKIDIKNGEGYLTLIKAVVAGLNHGRIEIPSVVECLHKAERKNVSETTTDSLSDRLDEIRLSLPLSEAELLDKIALEQNNLIEQVSISAPDTKTMAQRTADIWRIINREQSLILKENMEKSRSFCTVLKARLLEDLEKRSRSESCQTVTAFEEKKKECATLLKELGVGPALNEILKEFDNECEHLHKILYIQFQESEEMEKQAKIRDEAWKAQTEALAKKVDEDRRLWKEEKEQMQKQFEQEIAQAKKANEHLGSPGKIWVNPYKSADGTKVSGYYRRK